MTLAVTPPTRSTPPGPVDPGPAPGGPVRRRVRSLSGRTWAVTVALAVLLAAGLIW